MGVTPNKLLSKIASELDKPDGLTVLTAAEVPQRIWPLPVRRINGIGPKAGEAMIKAHFGNGGVPNPLATILRDQDTLKLSSDQHLAARFCD